MEFSHDGDCDNSNSSSSQLSLVEEEEGKNKTAVIKSFRHNRAINVTPSCAVQE